MTAPTVERARTMGETEISALAADLGRGLSGEVRADRAYRMIYATDASIYQMEPVAVTAPRDTADVQHIVAVAKRWGVPVLPRGGATGLAGQTVNHAIVMDFTPHMNEVLEIDREAGWARVQPGTVLAKLNFIAGRQGLQYGVDPSTQNRATIGGGIANNSCGAHSLLFGKTIDQVMRLDVVLADGSATTFDKREGDFLAEKLALPGLEGDIYREVQRLGFANRDEVERRFPKIMRRVSGYNLDDFGDPSVMDLGRMTVGSEGTLAIVTEAQVRLAPVPAAKGLAALHFDTVLQACAANLVALEHSPSAVELIDGVVISRCRASTAFRRLADFVEGDPGGMLLVEFYGDSVAEVEAKLERLKADFQSRGLGFAWFTTSDVARQRAMWRMREAGQGLLLSVKGDTKPVAFVEDAAVAPERLEEFVARFQEITAPFGSDVAYYGHASVGCLHIRPRVNIKTSAGLAAMEETATKVADLCLEFGGSLSGEHGDGILRGVFTERMFGPQLYQAFREIKQAFDPDGLLNPGKIIDTPKFSENLRLGPETSAMAIGTYLDFTPDGGFTAAVEQCNGQGACRKMEGGMCPSYMVTMDEEHSTRGRANLLRVILDGAMPASELTGQAMHDALDLCVECKACKAECPSGVDMARIKYEWLTHYNEANGVPLRSRLFANIRLVSRLTSPFGGIANFVAGLAPVRGLMAKFGGIHPERPLPRFAGQSFPAWFAKHAGPANAPRGEAVYFHDTFTDYYHPEAGIAAVRVLEALGYRVTLVGRIACCGRPAISKGMLGLAREWARKNIDLLAPYARRGVPIVGTEPSCLLTLRDEYPELVVSDAAKAVAENALLLDELIARLAAEDPGVASIFRQGAGGKVLLHGHCHQKATAGADVTLAALRLIPGAEVELIDTGCCGMAGSFGFEKEHYEVSKAMGALKIFPAVEAADPATQVAITGVSCRQQIGHFTSRTPRHSAEILADALK